jgi:predicted DNA-binding antitoxin AbrB/MazE fold protein
MATQKLISAVYEGGMFKPLEPVGDLSEHEQVQLMIETEAAIEQRIAESERLARESFEGLTDEQLAIIEDAKFDQEHFFDHSKQDD